MRFAVTAAGLVAVASASLEGYAPPAGYGPASNMTMTSAAPSYVTEVYTQYTTYCPGPTSITHNGVTYTVTEATTLTITNCPCTVTKPVYSSVVSSCSTCSAPAMTTPAMPTYPASMPVSPVGSSPVAAPPAPYPSGNATVPAYTPPATGTGAYTPPASTSPIAAGYTGAASKASFGVAGLLAAAGLVVAL